MASKLQLNSNLSLYFTISLKKSEVESAVKPTLQATFLIFLNLYKIVH